MITDIYSEVHVPHTGGTCRMNHLEKFGMVESVPHHARYKEIKHLSRTTPVSYRRNPLEVAASVFFKWRDRLERENSRKIPKCIEFDEWVLCYVAKLPFGLVRELENHSYYWQGMTDIYRFEEFPEVFHRLTGIDVKGRYVNKGDYPDIEELYTRKTKKVIMDRFKVDVSIYGIEESWCI